MSQVLDYLTWAYDQMDERERQLVEPKRIPTPVGYHSTKCVAASLFTTLSQAQRAGMTGNLPEALERSTYGLIYRIVNQRTPIFFVSQAFAEAIAATSMPDDTHIGSFKFPFEAFVLAFPLKFMEEYTGREVCYVSVAHMGVGTERSPILGAPDIEVPESKVGIRFLADSPVPNRLSNLVSVYKDTDKLGEAFEKYTYTDFTGIHEESQAKDDSECLNKVVALVFKLLAILEAKPDFLVHGSCTRPESIKKGRKKDALWSPNWIGERYQPKEPKGGHRASPGVQRVRGHMHTYLYGPSKSLRKRIWTEPYWKGLD
jgi:hypothetical protein